MDGVVRVNLATVIAVSSFAEQSDDMRSDDMRRNLYQTVRVEPHADGGAVMVSTDGHILGLGYDPEAKTEMAPAEPVEAGQEIPFRVPRTRRRCLGGLDVVVRGFLQHRFADIHGHLALGRSAVAPGYHRHLAGAQLEAQGLLMRKLLTALLFTAGRAASDCRPRS